MYQSIETKYLPATNFKPSRVKATASGGASVIVSYDDDNGNESAHRIALNALCKKLNWNDATFIGGATKAGYVWVCLHKNSVLLNSSDETELFHAFKNRGDSSTKRKVSQIVKEFK